MIERRRPIEFDQIDVRQFHTSLLQGFWEWLRSSNTHVRVVRRRRTEQAVASARWAVTAPVLTISAHHQVKAAVGGLGRVAGGDDAAHRKGGAQLAQYFYAGVCSHAFIGIHGMFALHRLLSFTDILHGPGTISLLNFLRLR